jgi:hypothetical protein
LRSAEWANIAAATDLPPITITSPIARTIINRRARFSDRPRLGRAILAGGRFGGAVFDSASFDRARFDRAHRRGAAVAARRIGRGYGRRTIARTIDRPLGAARNCGFHYVHFDVFVRIRLRRRV